MDTFVKAAGLCLLAVILWQILTGYSKNFAILLSIGVCCMIAVAAVGYLDSVLAFFIRLQDRGGWNGELMQILIKSVGIGLVAEMASLICSDAGNSAMGKAVSMIGIAVILWLSLPLFSGLLDLIDLILGGI